VKRLDLLQLDARAQALVKRVGELARDRGLAVYLVGGAVRDLLLRCPCLDVDIVVEGDGIAFARVLADDLGGKAIAYPRFGTATICFFDGMTLDIVTARQESYARPGALPEVRPGTLADDLLRRDFTINALAASILPDQCGVLRDDHNGMNDLEAGQIRILHERSFIDDPTRILRAVRYEARFGFKMERGTLAALNHALEADCYATIVPVRYWNEFRRVLEEANPLPALERLCELGALRFFSLDVRKLETVHRTQQFLHKGGRDIDIAGARSWHILCAALVLDLNRKDTERLLTKLGMTRNDKRKILDILQNTRLLGMLVGNSRPSGTF
jgi:tRNA nucleotidyltransferase (CCA-adding enzyme)